MTQEHGQIDASQSLGDTFNAPELRSDGRTYYTGTSDRMITSAAEFWQICHGMSDFSRRNRSRRDVIRVFCDNHALFELQDSLSRTHEYYGQAVLASCVSFDAHDRQVDSPSPETAEYHHITVEINYHDTDQLTQQESWRLGLVPNSPELANFESKIEFMARNYRIVFSLDEEHVSQLHTIWSDAFRWTEQQIRDNLVGNDDGLFAGVIRRSDNALVAGVVAEYQDLGAITYVETTEWRSIEPGVFTGLLAAHYAQVLTYFNFMPQLVLVAESNLSNINDSAGSPGAAARSGLTRPSIQFAEQIYSHNVLTNPGRGFRDKTQNINHYVLVTLSRMAREQQYTPAYCQTILNAVAAM